MDEIAGDIHSVPALDKDRAAPPRQPSPPRKWARAPDWVAAMPTIKKLYKDERKTLKEVMDIMERQHNFYATPKMYKSKLKEWDISKSFKAHEILAVFHAMEGRQAEGKPSQFIMRGKEVDLKWVRHYIKRNRSRMKIDLNDRSPSPAAASSSSPGSGDEIVCRTIAPRPAPCLAASSSLRSAEELLHSMNVYIEGSWASHKWFRDTCGVLRSRKGEKGSYYLLRLWRLLDTASQLMCRSEQVDLVGLLNPGFAYLDDIVRDESPRAVPFLLSVFEVLHARGRQDLIELFLNYIKNISLQTLGSNHPQTKVWEQAVHIYPGGRGEMFQAFFSWLLDTMLPGNYQTPCRLDRVIRDHKCAEVTYRGLQAQESRLRLHIRMVEQDYKTNSFHDKTPWGDTKIHHTAPGDRQPRSWQPLPGLGAVGIAGAADEQTGGWCAAGGVFAANPFENLAQEPLLIGTPKPECQYQFQLMTLGSNY